MQPSWLSSFAFSEWRARNRAYRSSGGGMSSASTGTESKS